MTAIEPDHDYAVLELGASGPGEIAAMAELARPSVGVITCIGDAHLAGFGSREQIALAKAELLAALPADGRAVLGDDPWLRSVASKSAARITWVGVGEDCDLRATEIRNVERATDVPSWKLPVFVAAAWPPLRDGSASGSGRGPNDRF